MFAQAIEAFGRIDVLVTNAGPFTANPNYRSNIIDLIPKLTCLA
jgi:NAD(P)-dependent dehydrogenase (short-subunit alcohol dehydrogenase family)